MGLLWLGCSDDLVVDLVCALVGIALLEAVAILEEALAFGDHAELHGEHDLRADVDVGSSEAITANVIAKLEELIKNGDDPIEIAVPEHALALGWHLPAHRMVGERLLNGTCRVEEPPIIITLLIRAWPQHGFGKHIGQIG